MRAACATSAPRACRAPRPAEWICYSRARDAGLNETRVRARSEHPEETKETLTRTELMTVPGTVGDPLRVLMNMPGVARVPFGLGLLVVRGASPQDTGVFIAGEPIPVLYHFLAGPSVFTANLIEKIDFHPGGFRRALRAATSAAPVDVTIRGDVGRTPHGAVDINLRDSAGVRRGPARQRLPRQLRRPAQLHRRRAARGAAAVRRAAHRLDVHHVRARSTGTTRGASTRTWRAAGGCR
jgi:hypothetical protein